LACFTTATTACLDRRNRIGKACGKRQRIGCATLGTDRIGDSYQAFFLYNSFSH
jgi:hypothetical protein